MTKDDLIEELDVLLANGHIEIIEGFGKDAKYVITDKGREYLEYLKDEQSQ